MKTLRDEDCRIELKARIESLSPDARPAWGKMNVEQMLSHLVQAAEMPFESSVPDASTFLSRKIVKHLVLYVMPIPKEVKTSAELDQQQKGRRPLGFDADKKLVVESIDRLGHLANSHPCLAHPFFGPMNAREWALLAHKHIDHHLRQFGV